MPKIIVLITTFLRDNLLYKTLQSIIDNYPNNSIVLIADQGYHSEEKDITIDYYKSQIPLEYYYIPFDSGLGAGRNYLVNKAKELNIPYILISADNIQFTQPYNFQPIIEFLESDINNGIVAFDINYKWMYDLEINNKRFYLKKANHSIEYKDIKLQQYDLVPNFFLCKTQVLIDNPWNDEFNHCDSHIPFFWDLKNNTQYKVYWTNYISAKRQDVKNEEYKTYRDRCLSKESRKIVQAYYGLADWLVIEK